MLEREPAAARPIITVDGPAASGKGTLARALAATLGFAHLDTGKLYRAVALALLRKGADPGDAGLAAAVAGALDLNRLDDPALGQDSVGQAASIVAAHASVRAALLDRQRAFALAPPGGEKGAVLDGRDTGTVICPEATLKLFLVATPEERARRRDAELRERGEASIYATVLAEIMERDRRDETRAVAPLRPAADAVIIDTTRLDAASVLAAALAAARAHGLADGAR